MKPEQVDGRGRAYVPDTVAVISATRLLNAGERQTLSLTVPNEEGDNEFVCTFPGHYQLMWGKLIVTKDVDAYLQKHPRRPLQAAGLGSTSPRRIATRLLFFGRRVIASPRFGLRCSVVARRIFVMKDLQAVQKLAKDLRSEEPRVRRRSCGV